MLGDLARGCGLEYGVKERGVNVVDEVCEVGFGPGARVKQRLKCVVLELLQDLWGALV